MNVREYSSVRESIVVYVREYSCLCKRIVVCLRESIVVYASEYSSVFREFE